MFIKIALILSVLLQFGAFFITISLIPKTKLNVAWISISIGFFLMAIRRINDLFLIFPTDSYNNGIIFGTWTSLAISIAMLISSFFIRKILELLNTLYILQKKNEARVLAAIISTEENERKIFAKELHDGLGPILSTMKMSLSALNNNEFSKNNKEIIKKTEYAIDNAITTTKEISNHLNPQVLERFGLKKALRTFIDNVTMVKDIEIRLTTNTNKERFENNIEVILYRVICELINNTIKHASASIIKIFIHLKEGYIECRYNDNGIGFAPQREKKGMGLLNIQSRIKSINGEIDISSQPQKGMTVFISLPTQLSSYVNE